MTELKSGGRGQSLGYWSTDGLGLSPEPVRLQEVPRHLVISRPPQGAVRSVVNATGAWCQQELIQ
jgi:hypothetical protein